ncbi:hypothetical protein [Halobacteriovorax sp. RT-2-4]|uniref:hypothetical protein n=1 Tax=unclassified Halobacteriovorax TaxID=2639665 RepID=UPI00399B60F2
MKKLLLVAMLSLTAVASPVSNSVIAKAKKAVEETAKSYFGPKAYVYYSNSSAEDKEVFFNVLWTEETTDVFYDEGEQIYVPVKTECEQEMVYLVDTKKVLLTQNAYCY